VLHVLSIPSSLVIIKENVVKACTVITKKLINAAAYLIRMLNIMLHELPSEEIIRWRADIRDYKMIKNKKM
jgi:hypothetical protein